MDEVIRSEWHALEKEKQSVERAYNQTRGDLCGTKSQVEALRQRLEEVEKRLENFRKKHNITEKVPTYDGLYHCSW